ncbi:MAG: HEAT repeat domain-containing protein [Planctomycetales bacterium]|nr:HEAT repeat domain-containing protein [Planctomycetales bacterium]
MGAEPDDFRERVTELIRELDGPAGEDAFHSLLEVGTAATPILAEAFHHEPDGGRRQAILNALWELRDPAALPTLALALRDPDDRVWKEVLDGLVAIGGPAASRILEEARDALPGDRKSRTQREWIEEALQQVREPWSR